MEKQQTQETVNYWKRLHTFYTSVSTMALLLVDNNGKVCIQMSPVISGKEGRPQAGEQKYDYNNTLNFTLSLHEIQTIVTSYERGMVLKEPVTFIHNHPTNGNVIGAVQLYNNKMIFGINHLQKNRKLSYAFNAYKINKDSNTYINAEFELFINLLKSVIQNMIFIKSNLIPPYVKQQYTPQNNNGAYNNYNKQNNNNNSYNNYNTQSNMVNTNNTANIDDELSF